MNEALENNRPIEPEPDGESWPWRKIFFLVALAFVLHLTLIFFFGSRKQIVPRSVTNAPHLQLADSANELIALDNPALFALPNPDDFASAIWQRIPAVTNAAFHYEEPPHWLASPVEKAGVTFRQFMRTNCFAPFPLDFKPQPVFAAPMTSGDSALPQHSTFKILGTLAQRRLLDPESLPSLEFNDVMPPARVQVLVDAPGTVVSAILLPSYDNSETSDFGNQRALEFARRLRFIPAPQPALGEILFLWHTVPVTVTNTANAIQN
jgi:hypothetical protein